MSTVSRIPIILDSDGGIDDATALWRVCRSSVLDLIAVTVTGGNVGVDQAAVNLATVLEVAGCGDVPVALGDSEPYGSHPEVPSPASIHGADGLGAPALRRVVVQRGETDAIETLHTCVRDRPGEVTVIAIGPLTNLAGVIERDPLWPELVDRLIFMGGSARRGGNVSALAEANIAHDPSAAEVVLGASWRRPPLMGGMDVTAKATFGDDVFTLLKEHRNAAARFLDGPLHFYRVHGSGLSDDGGCPCHDLLAVLAAEDPELLTVHTLPVGVDVGGSAAWGATVVDTRGPMLRHRGLAEPLTDLSLIDVALDVDLDRFAAAVDQLLGMRDPDRQMA